MIKNKPILDDHYYKVQMLINDPYFKKSISWLLARFNEIGCPVPEKGFKTYKDYENWNKKYWDKRSEMINSDDYKIKVNKITKEKESWDSETQKKLEDFKYNYLPPVYGAYFRDILNHFGITLDFDGFRDFLVNYVFFKKDEYPHTTYSMMLQRNKNTNEIELYLRIFGYTKKEDIERIWPKIEEQKKSLPDYYGKNKEKKLFNRDLEIYSLYKEFNSNKPQKKGENIYENKRVDEKICIAISEQYGDIEWENVRKIISRMRILDKKFVKSKEAN